MNRQGRLDGGPEWLGWKQTLIDGAQLIGLWSITVIQPLFSDLRSDIPLLTAGLTGVELAILALGLVIVPPLAMLAVELAVGLVSNRARTILHIVILSGLVAVFTGSLAKRAAPETGWLIVAVIALTIPLAALALWRLRTLRLFAAWLALAPALFVIAFVADPPSPARVVTGDPELAQAARRPVPVMLIVFDEFPASSILDAEGRLDRKRLPNFARLARDATWYPDAVSVADETLEAVPAILSGRRPEAGSNDSNVFTLLGRTHRMHALETFTRLCPARLCPRNAPGSFGSRLDQILEMSARVAVAQFLPRKALENVLDLLRPETEEPPPPFEDGIVRSSRPTLHFLHSSLPHSPWTRLPSGQSYTPAVGTDHLLPGIGFDLATGVIAVEHDNWIGDGWLVRQAQQAHLAQVGATDQELGKLMRLLRRSREYERALVIVTADHGVAFDAGAHSRELTPANGAAILRVPLFVKLPHQRRGERREGVVRTVDIVPTIADVLEAPAPVDMDGRSLVGPPWSSPERVSARNVFADESISVATAALQRGQAALVDRQARLFGDGSGSLEIFDFGPLKALTGTSAPALARDRFRRVAVALDRPHDFANVDTGADTLPAAVSGRLLDGVGRVPIVVVLNGRVAASTWPYEKDGELYFAALVDPSRLRQGENRVEILARP